MSIPLQVAFTHPSTQTSLSSRFEDAVRVIQERWEAEWASQWPTPQWLPKDWAVAVKEKMGPLFRRRDFDEREAICQFLETRKHDLDPSFISRDFVSSSFLPPRSCELQLNWVGPSHRTKGCVRWLRLVGKEELIRGARPAVGTSWLHGLVVCNRISCVMDPIIDPLFVR